MKPLTIDALWELAKFHPNPQQKEAILHTGGPLYITAGPGSGKTRVLLWRALNLIVFHQAPPGKIFLSTFTEKAAHQLKEGLRSLLGMVTNRTGQPYDLSGMYIGTVHSLCSRMLTDRRRFFADRVRHRAPALLDALGQYFFLYDTRTWETILRIAGLEPEEAPEIINALFGRNSQSKHRAVTQLMAFFNRFSEEMIDPQVARERLPNAVYELDKIEVDDVELLLTLYEAYSAHLHPQGPGGQRTDFALLQREAFDILEAFPDAGSVFQHVIVDEYQDTNTIQERIFFKLAGGTGNICVVGDDDQALYRFRGATVENFVQFPQRCQDFLGQTPRRVSLGINYRSRKRIVDFYSAFMQQIDWTAPDGAGAFRVLDKEISAERGDERPSVVANTPAEPLTACREIAVFIRRLIDDGKVENPNQIAFLYPSLKSTQVPRMIAALEAAGLQVYAPRAGSFLAVDEAQDVFGVFLRIFGRPAFRGRGREVEGFRGWLDAIENRADELAQQDPRLNQFIRDRQDELSRALFDYQLLMKIADRRRWDLQAPYDLKTMKRTLTAAPGLSEVGKRLIGSAYLDRFVTRREREGRPLVLNYIIRRATSMDWNVLDLFYRLMGFEHFKAMFDQAERHGDEGPVANLGLITQYLQRFNDDRVSIITANLLEDGLFAGIFFSSFLFALYRLGESELENPDDPFPRGRIPFLTIHQAKGLEFPVVVLGNPAKRDFGPSLPERVVRPLLGRQAGEPLDRMTQFDIMRMFYVALSRAKNLLILAHFQGRGQRMFTHFKPMLNEHLPRLNEIDLENIPPAQVKDEDVPRVYSFTGDYLLYLKCPRQYMVFRKFGFVPSRAQTMFFGSLVHRTIEDLHHELIRRRAAAAPVEAGNA